MTSAPDYGQMVFLLSEEYTFSRQKEGILTDTLMQRNPTLRVMNGQKIDHGINTRDSLERLATTQANHKFSKDWTKDLIAYRPFRPCG